MIKTQVYLPKSVYHSIEVVARRDQKPKAQVIRELLEEGLEKQHPANASEALLQLAKIDAKGPADLSRKIDTYLYEDP